MTRLSLAGVSDLDLVIRLPRVRVATPAMTPGDLEGRNAIKETWPQELARRLRSEPWVAAMSVRVVASARVPVVKLATVPLGDVREAVRLDVSFEGPWHRAVWKSTAGLGGPDQTSEFSISIKSKSIRLIFGRNDCSRRVLDAKPKRLRRNCRVRPH